MVFSSSSVNRPVATSLIGTPLRLEIIRLRWSSFDISVSSINTGIPLVATLMATLSPKTLFPTLGLADTKSTQPGLRPPPIAASYLANPVGIPI